MSLNLKIAAQREDIERLQSDAAKREQYIESALERIAELETQLENERAAHFTCVEMRNEAEAERDRLRSALQMILELKHEDLYHGSEVSHAHAVAREALNGHTGIGSENRPETNSQPNPNQISQKMPDISKADHE